jgi:hypothetical protein
VDSVIDRAAVKLNEGVEWSNKEALRDLILLGFKKAWAGGLE